MHNVPILKGWHEAGTGFDMDVSESSGDLAVRNWRGGPFPQARSIGGRAIKASFGVGMEGCFACPLRCKKKVKVDSPYVGWFDLSRVDQGAPDQPAPKSSAGEFLLPGVRGCPSAILNYHHQAGQIKPHPLQVYRGNPTPSCLSNTRIATSDCILLAMVKKGQRSAATSLLLRHCEHP